MTGLMIFGLLVSLIPGSLGLLDQKKMWWRFQAKNYAHPEHNEPSEGAFRPQRIALICCSLGFVTLIVWPMATAPSPS
ncbi:hypothetical protein [Streptomyces abyssomicinicus]|uniref:hypothetical protein n=1 Tax=Streptomyces abyssomicinicus TaxID=574929 RepID=UPI001250AB96|nr:hypothetical protein [Streptomyces abyssomicinicus]